MENDHQSEWICQKGEINILTHRQQHAPNDRLKINAGISGPFLDRKWCDPVPGSRLSWSLGPSVGQKLHCIKRQGRCGVLSNNNQYCCLCIKKDWNDEDLRHPLPYSGSPVLLLCQCWRWGGAEQPTDHHNLQQHHHQYFHSTPARLIL